MPNISFLSLVLSLILIQTIVACPSWTIPFNQTGKCYWFPPTQRTLSWVEAEARCNCLGGHLATIDNGFENAFVNQHINVSNKNAFIGAFRVYENNTDYWKWTESRRVVYSNWNVSTNGNFSEVSNGIWYQTRYALYYYVCEIPKEGLSCPQVTASTNHILSFWTHFSSINTCYQRDYDLKQVSFFDAALKCDNLLSIHSSQENDVAADYIRTFTISTPKLPNIWVGIFDPYENGTFQWYDGTPLNYTNWAAGEPRLKGINACVIFGPKYQWVSTPCNISGVAICKTPAILQNNQTFPAVCSSGYF